MKGASVSFFISFVLIANLQNAESIRMSFEEIKTALQPISKMCIERVGVNPKLIDDASNNNFVPDRKLQCYFKCMLVMTKVMKNDMIVERALFNIAELMLNEELVTPVMSGIKHCHPILSQSKEGCELAYETIKCFYEFGKAVFLVMISLSFLQRIWIILEMILAQLVTGPLQQSMHYALNSKIERKIIPNVSNTY